MISQAGFKRIVQTHFQDFYPVVPVTPGIDKVAALDLSGANVSFTPEIYNDLDRFIEWINAQRSSANAIYLVGGYKEKRQMYQRSSLFSEGGDDAGEEDRSIHLGVDIWADAGTPVFSPLESVVHSCAFNDQLGDYGATIILEHQLEGLYFFTLYGHLSLRDIEDLRVGEIIPKGTEFAHFGPPAENGQWPPHLHFQLILDIGQWKGDYPGVCRETEAPSYLANSPDPSLLLPF